MSSSDLTEEEPTGSESSRPQSARAIYMDAPPVPSPQRTSPPADDAPATPASLASRIKMTNVPSEFLLTSICSAIAKCMSIPTSSPYQTHDGSGDSTADAVYYSLYEHLLRLIQQAEQVPGKRSEIARLLRDLEEVSLQLRTSTMPLCSATNTSPVATYDNQIDTDLLDDRKSATVLGIMRPAFTLEQTLINEEGLDEIMHDSHDGEDGDDAEFEENTKTIRKYFCPQAMQLTSLANAAELPLPKDELLLISTSINRLANLKLRKLNVRSVRFWGKISLVPQRNEATVRPSSAAQRQAMLNTTAYYIVEADFPDTSSVWSACDKLSTQYEETYAASAKYFKQLFHTQKTKYETFRMRGQNQMQLAASYVNRENPPEQPPEILKLAAKENYTENSKWPELPPLPRTRDIVYQEYSIITKGKNPADLALTADEAEEQQMSLIPRDPNCITGTNRYVYYCTTNLGGEWILLPHTSPRAIRHARQRLNERFTGELNRSMMLRGRYYGKECEYLRSQIARISHGCALAPQSYVQTDDEAENEDGLIEFMDNPDFETSPLRDVLEQKQDFFVHARPYLYKQGRCSFIELPNPDDDEELNNSELDEEELEAVLNMLGLEEPPPPPSVLRKPSDTTIFEAEPPDLPQPIAVISEDVAITSGTSFALAAAEFAQQRPWATRTTNFLLPEMASVLARSCMWPGACFVYQQNQLENFYIGFGTKQVSLPGDSLMPHEVALPTQKEFVVVGEQPQLQEQDDTSVQIETEHVEMMEKKKRAAEENEEDGATTEYEEGDEEEGDEGDDDQY